MKYIQALLGTVFAAIGLVYIVEHAFGRYVVAMSQRPGPA